MRGRFFSEKGTYFFDRNIVLRRIIGLLLDNGVWKSHYNHELYKISKSLKIVQAIKASEYNSWDISIDVMAQNQ